MDLKPGDEYIVEWGDATSQRYRVEEIRGDMIVRRRWIEHLDKWTDWVGVTSAKQLKRFKVAKCST